SSGGFRLSPSPSPEFHLRHSRGPHRSSRIGFSSRPARRPALPPNLLPIPYPRRHPNRQRKSQLMRQHTHLPAMVRFVTKHVANHFHASRPWQTPAVSAKLLHPALTAQRFRQHL